MSPDQSFGRVCAIWRYPVKSMAGEALDACMVTERGLLGDRAYALVDELSGSVASAKNPRLWPNLLHFSAALGEAPELDGPLPPVKITLPDGREVMSGTGASSELSSVLGRRVLLSSCPPERPTLQQFWPDLDGTTSERVTDEAMPAGTFFDLAIANVIFTTTFAHLSMTFPQGQFDVRRFRPNIVIAPHPDEPERLEADTVGRTLSLGNGVRLRVDSRCARCVMTTLAQHDLAKDLGILRTVARANGGCAGLNTTVMQGGMLRVGDHVGFATE